MQTMEELPEIMTAKQLAAYYQISEITVRRALKTRHLNGFKIGTTWYSDNKSAVEWVENHLKAPI